MSSCLRVWWPVCLVDIITCLFAWVVAGLFALCSLLLVRLISACVLCQLSWFDALVVVSLLGYSSRLFVWLLVFSLIVLTFSLDCRLVRLFDCRYCLLFDLEIRWFGGFPCLVDCFYRSACLVNDGASSTARSLQNSLCERFCLFVCLMTRWFGDRSWLLARMVVWSFGTRY